MFVVFPANPTNPSPKAYRLHLAVLVFPTTLLSDPILSDGRFIVKASAKVFFYFLCDSCWKKHSFQFLSNSLSSCWVILRRGPPGHLVIRSPTTSGGLGPTSSRCRIYAQCKLENGPRWWLWEPGIGQTTFFDPSILCCPPSSPPCLIADWQVGTFQSSPETQTQGGARSCGGWGSVAKQKCCSWAVSSP